MIYLEPFRMLQLSDLFWLKVSREKGTTIPSSIGCSIRSCSHLTGMQQASLTLSIWSLKQLSEWAKSSNPRLAEMYLWRVESGQRSRSWLLMDPFLNYKKICLFRNFTPNPELTRKWPLAGCPKEKGPSCDFHHSSHKSRQVAGAWHLHEATKDAGVQGFRNHRKWTEHLIFLYIGYAYHILLM